MKFQLSSATRRAVLALLVASVLVPSLSRAVVGVTISPSVITNDYAGKITITVTGLTAGKTIRIEKYGDFNTNGVINSPENLYLWRSFTVTDGQLPLLAGCTNLNVVGDMDAATNGQIRAELFYPGTDVTLDSFAIKYLIRVSDTNAAASFTPLTNSFEVRQKVYPQGVTGKVVASGTGFPLTNAVVVVVRMNAPGGYGAVADSGGNFTVYTAPGDYVVVTAYTNSILAGLVTVSSNVFTSQNFTSTPAPFTISGKVSDSSSGAGLPGILVLGQGSGGFTICFSDTNGNYSLPVTSGEWEVDPSDDALAQLGYVALSDGIETNVTGNVSGLNFPLPKATALIYGRLVDNFGNPVNTIDFRAEDSPNSFYQAGGESFATNGGYSIAVTAGNWDIEPESDTLTLAGFVGPASSTSVSLANGQCIQLNFTVLRATNRITGFVKDNSNNPIVDIDVNAGAAISGTNYQTQAHTDSTGFYSLNVANGNWSVNVDCDGDEGLISLGYCCVDNQNVNIAGTNSVANFTAVQSGTVAITTASPLPDADAGSYYEIQFDASSCQTPFNWSLSPGSPSLPSGLFLASGGTLSGSPDTGGSNYFCVRVTDAGNHTADKCFSLIVNAETLQVTTVSLPNGTNGTFYTRQLQASGGQTPYHWRVPDYSADLPANLTLATNGVLSGTPAVNGTFYFDVEVDDAAANSAYQTLSLTLVNPPLPPLLITNASLPNGNVGAAYSAQLGATGGQSPYTWSLAAGSANPPPGLTLDSSGLISGTPSTNKVGTFKVQATDANFTTTNKILSITINPKPVLGSPGWLTNQFQMRLTGASNQNYTVQMSTNLSSTNWISLFITNNPTTNSFLLADPNATNKLRYYRALVGP